MASTWFYLFDNLNPSACGAFDCVVKMNTAAANDCSTYTTVPSTYGIGWWLATNKKYNLIDVDKMASSWPGTAYFLMQCKG